jgi:hypothetical protein
VPRKIVRVHESVVIDKQNSLLGDALGPMAGVRCSYWVMGRSICSALHAKTGR